jgi:type IV pilus assembly protein PilB
MPLDPDIERLTVEHASSKQISEVAIASGMQTLRTDGFVKAAQGVTSLDEIFRVVA